MRYPRRFPAALVAPLAFTRLAQSDAQKAPKRDADHGGPCRVLAISTQPKKGHFHDTRNSGLGPRHRHGTDNSLCVWSSPAGFDVTRSPRVCDWRLGPHCLAGCRKALAAHPELIAEAREKAVELGYC